MNCTNRQLCVEELTFSYPDGHEALNNISFKVKSGESVGIIGPNGAGKSTLLSTLVGILQTDQGKIRIDDVVLMKKTLPWFREKIGLVFQNPDDQLFMTTVFEDVAFGPRNYKLDERAVLKRVDDALNQVDAYAFKGRPSYKLSGGEKRRVAVATVLAMSPEFLIMDEPTSNLDPRARRKLIEVFKGLTLAKIITSHDLDMIYELCERVIVINHGRIIADGDAKVILTNSAFLLSCDLELPLSIQNCPSCGCIKL